MFQIPATRPMAKVLLLLLIALGASSCRDRSLNLNPHVPLVKTAKQQKVVPCDTKITADINTGGVDLDAAFLCENDTVTWQVQNRHSFHVKFDNGSPFQHGKVKGQYDKLEVYKYTITVDSKKPVDPQVIGGGNP